MANSIHSDPNNWLRTGLSDDRLIGIGLITIIWNSVEFDLQEVIWAALGSESLVCAFITADLNNVNRYQLAKNVINHSYKHERLRADALRAIEFFDRCRLRRNALVHGMPVYDDDKQLTGRMAKFEAKQGSGDIKITHFNVTHKFVHALTWDLWICRQALTDAKRKLERFRAFHSDEEISKKNDFEAYVFQYTAKPLDTAWLQKRLDQLRSVLPTQDTPEHPPLPSEA